MRRVQIEHEVGQPPDVAFEWFVDPERLTEWWPDDAETDPVVGGAYRMQWSGRGVTLRDSYVTVVRPDHLVFTWSWDHDDLPPRGAAVALIASARGTTVTVDHEAETDVEAADHLEGWAFFLDRPGTGLSGGRRGLPS